MPFNTLLSCFRTRTIRNVSFPQIEQICCRIHEGRQSNLFIIFFYLNVFQLFLDSVAPMLIVMGEVHVQVMVWRNTVTVRRFGEATDVNNVSIVSRLSDQLIVNQFFYILQGFDSSCRPVIFLIKKNSMIRNCVFLNFAF